MKGFYRSKVFVGYLVAAVLLGAAWVDASTCTTIFRWRHISAKHSGMGVDLFYLKKSLGLVSAGVTRKKARFYPRYEVLPSVTWEWEGDPLDHFGMRIPWGGVWLVFLVCGATSLRKKWLEVKKGGEG